jgi:ferredoxin
MKAVVDPDTCIGCEACVGICPEVFEMRGALAYTYTDPVPADKEASAREAAEACPTSAITFE